MQAHTSLVFPELYRLFQLQLVCINLGVKAIKGLEDDSQVAGTKIDRTPRGHSFSRVDSLFYVFQMLLTKALNRFALHNYC